MNSGVYEIKNTINNNCYIGSSCNLHVRILNHKGMLKNNKHHSIILQRAYNKYGKDNFEFNILQTCNCNEVIQLEQKYIDELKPKYNIKPNAASNKGFKHSKETVENYLKNYCESVCSFNENGKLLRKFESSGIAAKYYNINRSVVINSCKKKTKLKYKNLSFLYEKDYREGYKPTHYKYIRKKKSNSANIKSVFVYTLYNEYFTEFKSQKECADYFKCSPSTVCNLIDKPRLKNLITTEITKFKIFSKKANLENNKIKLSGKGNIKVYDVYENYIGLSNEEELSNLLKVTKTTIYNTKYKKVRVKSYTLEHIN